MSSREQVIERWQRRLAEWARLHTLVGGEEVAREILDDLKQLADAHESEPIGLKAAALESGYSTRQLSRMIAEGILTNAGRPHAPRLLRKDLPKKPKSGPGTSAPRDPSLLSIARDVTSAKSNRRGLGNGTAA